MKCKNTCVKMLDFTIKRKVQKWSKKCKNTYVKNVGFLSKTLQIMQRLIKQIWEASPKSDQGSARRDWPQVWSGWTSLPRSPSSWLPIFSSPLPHCPLIMLPCHNPCFGLYFMVSVLSGSRRHMIELLTEEGNLCSFSNLHWNHIVHIFVYLITGMRST